VPQERQPSAALASVLDPVKPAVSLPRSDFLWRLLAHLLARVRVRGLRRRLGALWCACGPGYFIDCDR
jgi:hypothetical protein